VLAVLLIVGVRVASPKITKALMATGFPTEGDARTFIRDVTIGLAGLSAACAAVSLRERVARGVARRFPPAPEGVEPRFSLSVVAGLQVILPFAVALLAAVGGMAIALPRSFIATAPFVALLAAQGLAAMATGARVAVGTVALGCFIAISGRFGAVPGLRPDERTLRTWLVHEHYDWAPLRAMLPAQDRIPIVTTRTPVTDGVLFYGNGHELARVKLSAPDAPLLIDQVRGGEGAQVYHSGEAFAGTRIAELYWIDAPLPDTYSRTLYPLARELLRQQLEKGYACREIGFLPIDEVHVYRCTAQKGAAAGGS
jgi:hypothetical protein